MTCILCERTNDAVREECTVAGIGTGHSNNNGMDSSIDDIDSKDTTYDSLDKYYQHLVRCHLALP